MEKPLDLGTKSLRARAYSVEDVNGAIEAASKAGGGRVWFGPDGILINGQMWPVYIREPLWKRVLRRLGLIQTRPRP